MIKNKPDIPHRRSIRLKGYDYSQKGYYFVTICTQNKICLFGKVENDEIQLNDAGRMIVHWYLELESKFPQIRCDAFVCMPNHIHFIVQIAAPNTQPKRARQTVGVDLRVHPPMRVPPDITANIDPDAAWETGLAHSKGQTHRSAPTAAAAPPPPQSPPTTTVGDVVQWFKTMTTKAYIRGVKQNGWPSFPGKLWQRNYWERIVRNDDELQKIRNYIINNPQNWSNDQLKCGFD